MFSSAPANRITRPWMTTTMSRLMRRHVEGQLRAALVERAEQDRGQHDAERVVAAHQRHRDADEAVAAGEVERSGGAGRP